MSHYDLVWAKCSNVFPILSKTINESDHDTDDDDMEFIIGELTRMEIAESVYETVWLEIDAKLRQVIVPAFWQRFQQPAANETNSRSSSSARDPIAVAEANERASHQFQVAVLELYTAYQSMQTVAKRLTVFRQMARFQRPLQRCVGQPESCELDELLRVVLLSQLPAHFGRVVHAFYSKSFRVFLSSQEKKQAADADMELQNESDDSDDPISHECTGCDAPPDACRCAELVQAFCQTNRQLLDMQLLDRLAGVTLTALIQQEVKLYIQRTTSGQFDMRHMARLEGWLDNVVLDWLRRIYDIEERQPPRAGDNIMHNFRIKLSSFLYETYATTLIDQFFAIIIEFPDSQPAIDDLRYLHEFYDYRAQLVRSAKQALQQRLLHPGVNTNDILTGYVSAIKAIRHLDSSGVLLETITEPVKQYMRGRADAVRCVVTALTEEGPADLAEELARSEAVALQPSAAAKQRADDLLNWHSWQPDPVDVQPKKSDKPGANSRTADIISMVVDIYGSKEMFVGEYRNLLADRLLAQLDFRPEKEIRNLELLKLRFGDAVLHNCEVMLKDISDSKRIDAHIHSDGQYAKDEGQQPFDIRTLILSSQFWPNFKSESLELPAALAAEFERYTKSYESYKGNRTLVWRPATGRVELEIEQGDRVLEMSVTPSQAAIIYLFQEREQWTLGDLSSQLKLPASVLRKRIAVWLAHGVVREHGVDVFVLVQDRVGGRRTSGAGGCGGASGGDAMQVPPADVNDDDDDEAESAMASASEQREEELQVFWSYIVGMLTNLDSMQLERIHQMLKMFASHGPGVEFSQEELKNFLQRKVREHKLIFAGGVYHLPK